jgi:AcrR family transcriptional regulator
VPKIARERTEENQRRIEAAALQLFTSQGFHGTNNREIADKTGVSTGTIYTYFPSKEAIFATLAGRYRSHLSEWHKNTLGCLKDPLSATGLQAVASAIRCEMYEQPEYFLLLLSDVIEFKNQHFLEVFHDVPQQLRRALGPQLQQVKQQPGWCGQDPAFVLASVYLYFFTYFLMERHMQGEQHLGLPDEQATERFIDLLSHGLWRGNRGPHDLDGHKALAQADLDRVEYLRFLSGRLWGLPPDVKPRANPAKPPILFLPQMPKQRMDENQLRIEAAALDLFTKQGFHGTNIRDIARKADVSQGAIYLYYASKEAIFEGLVRSYRSSMRNFLQRVFAILEDPFSKNDLLLFAAAMRSLVYDDAEYWLLMYIDVIEFRNRYFLAAFHDVPEQFRRLLGPVATSVKKQPGWCGQDPALVMSIVYFYFHTYFVIERLMHGSRHLGVADEVAMERFVEVLLHGLWQN